MGGVGKDDALDGVGGGEEGVVGVEDEIELGDGVRDGDGEDDDGGEGGGCDARGAAGGLAEGLDGEGDEDGNGCGGYEVIPGLEVVVLGEEGEVSAGPEEQRGEEWVAEEAWTPEDGQREGDEEERVKDVAHPCAVGDGVEDDGGVGR